MKLSIRTFLPVLLVLAWAGFWSFFALAELSDNHKTIANNIENWLYPIGAAVLFLSSAVIALRWKQQGGILLVLESIALLTYFVFPHGAHQSINTIIFLAVTLVLPPLISGILFVIWRTPVHGSRDSGSQQTGAQ